MLLYIGSGTEIIQSVDGSKFRARQVFTRHRGKVCCLNDCTDLSVKGKIKIFLHRRWWRRRIRLNPLMEKGIRNFLLSLHAKQNLEFDCYAFANLVWNIEPHKVACMRDFWQASSLTFSVLEVGSVIFLVNKKESLFHHAALYIGHDLYVSVYGAGGDLEFSTLEDMKRDFKAMDVLLATPLYRAARS